MARSTFDRARDARVRAAAFDWLAGQVADLGDVLSWSVLLKGFRLDRVHVPLLSLQGIFKPAVLDVPLSIRTSAESPYSDAFGKDGLLRYAYRGIDPNHRENQGLRFAMEERLPLVYFHALVKGRYLATWPVYIVEDDAASLSFFVAVDDADHIALSSHGEWMVGEGAEARRRYVTTIVRRRLHQQAFRERVILAYRHQCAACRLRHDELLDAAHIIPDADPEGEPVVSNGLALCRLHHAAFDRFFIGLTPDCIIQVRPDLLEEEDGPTLRHAIQGLHGQKIRLPHREGHRPNVELLSRRYERFLELASAG